MLTHPGIFSSFGSQRLTEDSVAADPSDVPRHGDVRMASLVFQCFGARHAYSSSFVLACHRLARGLDSDLIAKGPHTHPHCVGGGGPRESEH